MIALVSSRLDYINKNPNNKISLAEIEHEIQHLGRREKLASFVAFSTAIVCVIGIAGILGGGPFTIGVLATIAALGAIYSYFAKEAESALRSKQIQWMDGSQSKPEVEKVGNEGIRSIISWFRG